MFKLFTKDINDQDEMKPSMYQKEVSLCLHERIKQLKNISKYHNYFNSSHGGDFFDCFDVDPYILVFQNWEVKKQYVTSILIRNKTKKVKFISISVEESEIFLINPKQVRKIPSHSSLVYKVKFLPVHFINYRIKMTINSDGSFYNFEIIALPPRPIINFPDKIDFGKILINFNSMESVHLTNTGRGVGMAKIYTNCQDIYIEPDYIFMNPNDVLNVEIKFHPSVLGLVKEKIIIVYSTGEKLFIEIQAFVVSGNIFLNEEELVVKETFVTFNELSSLVVYNKTEYSLNFRWHLSKEKEEVDLSRVESRIFGCDSKTDNIFESLTDLFERKSNDSIEEGVFSIMPMEGLLSMNDSFTFIVMFSPTAVGKMESIFYLEVEGLEKRLHVKITGNALGPNINLNLSTLDVNDIYVNEKYNYQLFAKNMSLVRGTLRLLPLSLFDQLMNITVDMKETILNPSDILLINVNVTAEVIGSFFVELRFEIVESKSILKCILKGTAIEPYIKFNEHCIDFGTVPIGVRFDKYFTIDNQSSIAVRIKLHIPYDSVEDAMEYDDLITSSLQGLPEIPNEFCLDPKDVTIPGSSSVDIKVSLVANIAKKYVGDILISSELHFYEDKKLPVHFIAIAPEISCLPSSMILPYCFKGIEFEEMLVISNKGNVQVSFWLLNYEDATSGVCCHRKVNEITKIDPADSVEFTFMCSIGIIGEHTFTAFAYVLGNGIVPLCDITITGIGPVIRIETVSMVWPNIEIMNTYQKTFTMVNPSPITAEYVITLEKDPKLWIISTYAGIMEPDEAVNVTVTPNPIDVGLLRDRLLIQIRDSRTLTIKLEAMAKGSSIIFMPNIFPSIDFGPALRVGDNNHKILVSNIGSKAQLVILSADDTMTIKKIRTQGNTLGKYFQIEPSMFVLQEYSELVLWANLKSETLGIKEETIHCYTRFESKYKMTYLGSSVMRANFVDLNLTYDPSLLHFDVFANMNQDPQPLIRPFTMHIDWKSPVNIIMTVPEPFGIYKDDNFVHEESFTISIDNPLKTYLYFDPMFVKDYKKRSYSKVMTLSIVDYNYKKSYKISANVYFPNISLSQSYINFECIELFQSSQKEVKIRNDTPSAISYMWYWISVSPSGLDEKSPQKSSMEIISTPSLQKNDFSEPTRNSLEIFKNIENRLFKSFKQFESEAKNSGLDVRPLMHEMDSHYRSNEKIKSVDEECASFIEFSPFFGELDAGDCKVTFINFTPRYYLCFDAVAVCVIEGGPGEKLVIQGCCSPINFEIIPDVINFGFAPCCELCKSMFIIKNNCLKKLPVKIHAPKLSHLDKKALEESSVWVDEDSGVVEPFSSVELNLTVWFGTIGEVDIKILLEVNNKPMEIKIFAYCCPNQVMVSLPRKFPQFMEEYLVLASLREPWFCIPEFFTRNENGWEKIIIPEMLPTTEDIYMGMECYFLHLSLYHHPTLFSEHFLAKKRAFTIKGFKVPSYLIDFGTVILGTKAEHKVKILNYYPREVLLKVICKDLSDRLELEFQDLRSYMILPPLGTIEFSVSILATNMFEKSDININYAFDIEVLCGPTIPISLSAVVSLPRLLVPDFVDFGAIKCNKMKIMHIPIKNIGIIPCEWIVYVRDMKGNHHELNNPKSYIKIPFIIQKPYGYTEPNASDHIPIYFKPMKKGEYNMILEFVINVNPEKITIPIKGIGLKPLILISDIDFGCVIPFSKPIVKTLEVSNLSSFPVQIFFPAYDDEIMAEASVFQAVSKYYKKDVYVPTTDDEIIPYNKICNIYRRICDEAIMFEKFSRLFNINEFYHCPSFGLKKSRSEIVFKKRYKLDLRRCKSLPNLYKSETVGSPLIDVCYKKSPDQVLGEYFDYLNCGYNPIPKFLTMKNGKIYCSKPPPFKSKTFTLIVVLGAPETGHIEWAAKLAKAFGMVSVSLDEIIFQELGESDLRIAEETRANIREIYIREIVRDDCFHDPRKYPCNNYFELKTMVEKITSECPSKLFKLSTAHVRINGIQYTQKLPLHLTAESMKEFIKNRISRYSTNVIIESVEGIFFSDVTFALSIMIDLFADNINFHIINLHSFPFWYMKQVRKLVELEADNNSKAIIEFVSFLHGIEHADILEDIPSFIRRYYYLFSVGHIEGRSEVLFPNHPELTWDQSNDCHKEHEKIISELESEFKHGKSPPFLEMMKKLCYDIIRSEDEEIIWTRSFISQSKLHSLLKEFLKYARWYSSLLPLWSTMRSSKSSRSSRFSILSDIHSRASKISTRLSKSFLEKLRRHQNMSSRSSRHLSTEVIKHPNDFDVITDSSVTKKSSGSSISSKLKIQENADDFDDIIDLSSITTFRSSRSLKSLMPEHPNNFDEITDTSSTKKSSKSSRSFQTKVQDHPNDFDLITDTSSTKMSSRSSKSFKSIMQEHPNDFDVKTDPLSAKISSRSSRSYQTNMPEHPPNDFDVITDPSSTKKSSRSSKSFKSITREHPNDFDVETDPSSPKISSRSSRSFYTKMLEHPNDFDKSFRPSKSFKSIMQGNPNDFDVIKVRSSTKKSSRSSRSFKTIIQEHPDEFYVTRDLSSFKKSYISLRSSKTIMQEHHNVLDGIRDPLPMKKSPRFPRTFKAKKQKHSYDSNALKDPTPSKKPSRLLSSFKITVREFPDDFEIITDPVSTKGPPKSSFKEDIDRHSTNFGDNTESRVSKKSSMKHVRILPSDEKKSGHPEDFYVKSEYILKKRLSWSDQRHSSKTAFDITNFKASQVVDDHPDLPLWILCTEDLNFDKFIPILCSQKNAFGIELPDQPTELMGKKEDLIPEPRVYFHLHHPKTVAHNLRLEHFQIYDKTAEMKRSQHNRSSSYSSNKSLGELPNLDFISREYLEPGEKASWDVVYSPVSCGMDSNKITVCAAGFSDCFRANIRGLCDIPTVAYEFCDLIDEMPCSSEDCSFYKSGFYVEESLYYFQPALISRIKKHQSDIHRQEATFVLSNISSVTANVYIDFVRETDEFDVQPKEVEIGPNEDVTVTIYASITGVGSFMEEIILSTLNNPLPQAIKVQSEGILPLVSIEPKSLRFKKTLLYQERFSSLHLNNSCYKAIYWEIASLDTLAPVIRCSKMSGIIEPYTNEEITVSFRPQQRIDYKSLQVKVADAESKELLKYKEYELHLHAIDLQVQIETNFNMQNYLEFGNIRVFKKYVSEIKLTKSINSKVFYRVRFATQEKKQSNEISDCITINSESEGYINKKGENLEVEVFCKKEVHFEKVEAIFFEIYSPFDLDLKIAEIPLIFSFHSHFPKYALYPGDCLDFGFVEIDTEKKLFLTIENIGFIDFYYSIKGTKFTSDSSSYSLDSSSVQLSRLNMICLPPLKIYKKKGNILPGKQDIYEVICHPKTAEKIVYEILLTIPELAKNPQRISISCTGIVPVLNFDIESLFRELYIVDTREELSDFPNNGCFVAVFIKAEGTLYFRNVSLYQTVNIDVFIENKSLLNCDVSLIVNGEGFSIEPRKLCIKSYHKEIVTLTYSPQRFGEHKGMVNIILDLPYKIENSNFTFLIEGSSELPSITIYDYFSEAIIKNEPIRMGFTTNTTPIRHLFRIQNSGNVYSQTIIAVESATNVTVVLGLVSIQNVIKPDSGCDTQSVTLHLHPKETAVMGCTLTPDTIGTYTLILIAYTVLNPYEKQKVIITGDAIIVNILLDGVTLVNYFQEYNSRGRISKNAKIFPNYHMDFGLCESSTVKMIVFYICNQSEHYWAFKFSSFDLVSFSPSIGYVGPHSRVKIESALYPDEQFPTGEEGALFLAKVKFNGENKSSEPKILWKIKKKGDHRKKSNETLYTIRSIATFRSVPSQKTLRCKKKRDGQTQSNKIIVRKIDYKIILLVKCLPVETSLFLSHKEESNKFRSTVVNQHSEEILFLQNISEASCHVIFRLEDISFREIDCDELEFIDKIGFVKMPLDNFLSDDPADEICFVNMNHVFPDDISSIDIFCPLFVQEMLLPESTIKAKFTFCPPKPGVFSANVRIIMDDTLLDSPQTKLSAIGFVPPIQIAFKNEVDKNEYEILGILSFVKCIKITAYEPKSFIRNKLIYVYNASNCSHSYNWHKKDDLSTIENSTIGFSCRQVSGELKSHSLLKLEMIFNPQDYGVYQSLWCLEVPDYNIAQDFLFIGETKIPNIIFEPFILSLDPVFKDMKVEKKIKIHNKENVSFKYEVDDISLYSDIKSEKLYIDPPCGVLESNMTHEVTISSTLYVPRKYVYKTFWSFENLARRWCLKVITQCLNVEVEVSCLIERYNIKDKIMLKENENNFINIGKVSVNDALYFIFVISNKGKVSINYEWVFSQNATDKLDIEVNPYDDIVPVCTEFSTLMKVTVVEKFDFSNIPFVLKIFKGPVYTFFFCGSAEDPLYKLSFREHDFGACLVQTSDIEYNSVNLQFENLDKQMLQIKLTSPNCDNFKIQLPCWNVSSESIIDIPINFFPREKKKYNKAFELFINDTLSDVIFLSGEGVLFQVDVLKPLKGIITFDKIGVDELIVEETQIVNTSILVFDVSLKIKNEYKELIEIKLNPTDIELRPNLLFKISVYIRCSSLGDYSGIEVWATCREQEMRLYCLTIHCIGSKIAFDRETINFFPHYRKLLHREEVAIINKGNIPTRFILDTADLPKIFKIEPLQGECLPGIPFMLNILCCLKHITDYLSAKVKCIEEGKNEVLELTLTTYPFLSGIELNSLKFLCPVRQLNTKSVCVKNDTQKTVSLMPLITGKYFSGEESFEIPKNSKRCYDILYKPLTMTKDDERHKGILVIPTQPVETVVKLEGRSTDPLLEGTFSFTAAAREESALTLTIENPLEILQKMSVRFRKNPSNKIIFNIDGSKCILLSSRDKKEYIVNFYAYKEGTVNFDVIFTNDDNFEYMFYNVTVAISPPVEIWETVQMETMIGHSVNRNISIYNPLEIKDTFTVMLVMPNLQKYLTIEPPVFDVNPKQHGNFSLIYSPSKLEKREVRLEVTGDLLGSYFYRIILCSGPPVSSNIISLSNPLGSKFSFILKLPKPILKNIPLPFKNEIIMKKKYIVHRKVTTMCHAVKINAMIHRRVICRYRKFITEIPIFKARSDSPEVKIKPLDDSSDIEELLCVYEPTSVGTNRASVTVEYFKPHQIFVFKLICKCEPAQQQGPFDVSATEPFILRFKNVLDSIQTYSCLCVYSGCVLEISRPVFTLQPKEVIEIEISVKDEDESKQNSTMLRITDVPEGLHRWDYYFNVHR